MSKIVTKTTRPRKAKVEIVPQTFAVDEKNQQGLVIFETVKEKMKFSVYLGVNVEVGLFLKESFKRDESGFALSSKIFKSMGHEIKKGVITDLDGDLEKVQMFVQDNETKKAKKINVGLLEILGMWTLKSFPLFADEDFIENCRDIKVEVKENSKPLKSDLYKKYGQKYLM